MPSVPHSPLLELTPLCSVQGWIRGEWHLDGLSFSSPGVAETKTQGLACSPFLSAALPRMPAFLPRLHAPPARAKKSSAPTGHIPRATSLLGLGHVNPAEQHTLRVSGACGLQTPHLANLQTVDVRWPLLPPNCCGDQTTDSATPRPCSDT